MPDKEEFVPLERAMKELKLKEDELKRLVSDGDISAYREGEAMKFRREDIERLKQDTGQTIQFTEDTGETLTDDLLFDDGDDLELDDDNEIGMATAPISSDETFVDDRPEKKPTRGGRRSSATRTAAQPSGGRGQTSSLRRTTGRSGQIRMASEAAKHEISALMAGVLVLSAIMMLYGCAIIADIANGEMSGVTAGIATSISDALVK